MKYKTVCSWCGKTISTGILPISHGICKSCYKKVMRQISKEKDEKVSIISFAIKETAVIVANE